MRINFCNHYKNSQTESGIAKFDDLIAASMKI
jgi:hypothetical protein